MYDYHNVVDHIEDLHITEDYINNLPPGQTLDYLVGKSCGMFHEHYSITDVNDPILDTILSNCGNRHSVIQDVLEQLKVTHEFYINHEYGTVYKLNDWTPSHIFFEDLAIEYRIGFIPLFCSTGNTIDASIDLTDNDKFIGKRVHLYFEAEGKTYSESMCKCILKMYHDFGYGEKNETN